MHGLSSTMIHDRIHHTSHTHTFTHSHSTPMYTESSSYLPTVPMSDLLQKWESMFPYRCQFQRSYGAGIDLFDQASNGGDETVLETHPEHPVGRLSRLGPGALPEETPHLTKNRRGRWRKGRQKRETKDDKKKRRWQDGRRVEAGC